MPDDTTARDLDSATSTSVAERPADPLEGSTVTRVSSQPPQSAHTEAQSLDDKPSTTEDFASALETFTTESEEAAREDNVLKGTVLKITATHVVVDIGAKSEGMLPIAEVLDHNGNPKFKPGDEIDVMRDKGETEEGYINLSHQKAQRLRAWDEIEKAHNEKKPIKAVVIERIKGGLTVDILGAQAFLPGSQTDLRPVRNLDVLKGDVIEVAVIKLNKKRGNIVGFAQAASRRGTERKEIKDSGAPGRGRGADRSGEKPDRVRRFRRPGRNRRLAAYHRYVVGPPHPSSRPGQCRRPDPGEGAEVRQGKTARLTGIQAADARPLAGCDTAIPSVRMSADASSASPTTAPSWNWSRASKAWCTSAR